MTTEEFMEILREMAEHSPVTITAIKYDPNQSALEVLKDVSEEEEA